MRVLFSVLPSSMRKVDAALSVRSVHAFKVSCPQHQGWITHGLLHQSLPNGVTAAVLAKPLDSIRFGKGLGRGRQGFFGRRVGLIRSRAGFLSQGSNFFRRRPNDFRRGLNLFRDGPNLFVSDKTKSVVDQTFSAVDITFSMTDQTFSSGRKLFPLRTKLIRSPTKVFRHRTKPSPSWTKLSPHQTQPFPCLIKSRSLGLNLSESRVFIFLPVAVGAVAAGAVAAGASPWNFPPVERACHDHSRTPDHLHGGGGYATRTSSPERPVAAGASPWNFLPASPWNERATISLALPTTSSAEAATTPTPWQARLRPFHPFHAHGSVSTNQTTKTPPWLKHPSLGMAKMLRATLCAGTAASLGTALCR